MHPSDLYALQITPAQYEAYEKKRHTKGALIVADKLYDQPFICRWIRRWLKNPTTPLEKLPLCVENEIRLKPAWYTSHVRSCLHRNDLETLYTTWVDEAIPEDIMDDVRMEPLDMNIINFLLCSGCTPTKKIFLHAVMESLLPLLKICFVHGHDINQQIGNYKPIEWCVAFSTEEAMDTCVLFGAEITSTAIHLSMRRPDMFFYLCDCDIQITSDHLKSLVEIIFTRLHRNEGVSDDYQRMLEECYARNVQAGLHYDYIRRVMDFITHPVWKASLQVFC